MQGLILAAGLGSRMKELTKNSTKSMVEVNGRSLIERMLAQLDLLNLNRIVVVDGYQNEVMENYIDSLDIKTPIEYVTNKDYDKTNNIFSVYLARDYFFEDDTIMIESDLIFADEVLDRVAKSEFENLAVVSKFESWMDGTVVKFDKNKNIIDFIDKKAFDFEQTDSYYKTVNIYKFSKSFSKNVYFPFLEAQMHAFGKNEYYETILQTISQLDSTIIKALDIADIPWYEIDDAQDLDVASSLFNTTPEKKFDALSNRYGGYWRYPKIIDFCYLVNPFYPPQRMLSEIKSNLSRLVIDYPSGIEVNSSLVAKYYNLPANRVIVGNGAAELIKSLMGYLDGRFGIIAPTFEEYPNRLEPERIDKYYPVNESFEYSANDIISFYDQRDIQHLVLINPDNPTGNYIPKKDILELLKWAKQKQITLILDESFGDFVNDEKEASLLERNIIAEYSNLIIVKSISKSFGVPGVRLGFLVSSMSEVIEFMKKDVSIWNINSFGEFFLQIFEKYKKDYKVALELFYEVRNEMYQELASISNLTVISSQANYFTCKLEGNISSRELAVKLLDEHKILIKDLSKKDGFNNENYIRVAVKKSEENRVLLNALKSYCS